MKSKPRLFPLGWMHLLCTPLFVLSEMVIKYYNACGTRIVSTARGAFKLIAGNADLLLLKFRKHTDRAVSFIFESEEAHARIKRVFGEDTKLARLFGNLFLLFVVLCLKFRIFYHRLFLLFLKLRNLLLKFRNRILNARLAQIMNHKGDNNAREDGNR